MRGSESRAWASRSKPSLQAGVDVKSLAGNNVPMLLFHSGQQGHDLVVWLRKQVELPLPLPLHKDLSASQLRNRLLRNVLPQKV